MKIFLDTEFTDFIDCDLISLGMVSEDGKEFYVERTDFNINICSSFVKEAVLPLLGRFPGAAHAMDELAQLMIDWLQSVRQNAEDIEICIDYETDWSLFADVLDNRVPPWCRRKQINHCIDKPKMHHYYQSTGHPQHHALYDAQANRYAYSERSEFRY